MNKVLIIGSKGQLGNDLKAALNSSEDFEVITLDHSQIELRDKLSVFKSILDLTPDIVINCAAYVRVDECEDNPKDAIEVNSIGAGFVANAASDAGAVCVYISTDYVFDGNSSSPYIETDDTHPVNIYGISKLSGEHMVKSYCKKHIIIRSSGLYGLAGSSGKGGNFIEAIINNSQECKHIKVVNDQILTPTYTADLSNAIKDLIKKENFGTFHLTNSGQCSWFEFAGEISKICNLNSEIIPCTSTEYGAKARRPKYSVLSNQKAQQVGIKPLRRWQDALEEYISLRA